MYFDLPLSPHFWKVGDNVPQFLWWRRLSEEGGGGGEKDDSGDDELIMH